jgi:hypothetical protein
MPLNLASVVQGAQNSSLSLSSELCQGRQLRGSRSRERECKRKRENLISESAVSQSESVCVTGRLRIIKKKASDEKKME